MAEFKLGRIRFVWKGNWTTGATYLIDDVVSNGGKSYICVTNHTAAAQFDTDLDHNPTRWNIVADGTQWAGNWQASHYYNPGAIVKYGALLYICKIGHSSATFVSPTYLGLEQDIGNWEVYATSFNWVGNWTQHTRYLQNDFVVYGGTTYVCNTGHISDSTANGLEADSENWDTFNQGVIYLGDWSPSSVRYKINDLVKYGANLWICTDHHVSAASFDEAKWDIFINGFQFENSWNNSTTYQEGDTVTYGGYSYISKTINIDKQPTTNASDWAIFTTGFNFRGEWDVVSSYQVGDVIRTGAYTYVALLDNTGQLPTNATYWSLLNSGFRWTNVPQTYLAVSSTTLTGSGAGAQFDVIRSKTVYTVSVTLLQGGANYSNGDKVKILGSSLGGISPANDITATVATSSGGAISTVTWTGGSSTWTTATDYLIGDVVTFGANSYICISAHTSNGLSRPDADTNGDYWNLIAAGSEYNILTETGDLVYYGPNGPTRLPVGINGQVLRSQNGYPIWANYGLINNLVYVSPIGNDVPYPRAGATIDQPWKTVRYAAKQVEDGYLNPNARDLLAKNKQFIMKEITNWVIYTYTVAISGVVTGTKSFTCTTTANLVANMPIQFSGTTGGVTAGQKYYVKTILSSTSFTISDIAGGAVKTLSAGSTPMTGTLSYDHTFCERDVGIIVEAVKFDISHGGTGKTTAAAKAYYTPAGNAYINSNLGSQITQTVAAYNYLSDLIINVISNIPCVSYQTMNGIVSAQTQILDSSLTLESGVTTNVEDLINIITTGMLAGSVTAIPAARYANTTISIKTGTFVEVLPIVVPEYTAMVGDELRSTVVQPKPANSLLVNDKPKTVSALTRINSVMSNLIQNTAITPTTGNNEVQQYINGYAGSGTVTTAVSSKTTVISTILSGGLGAVPSVVIPDPTGYDVGFSRARTLLIANKAFLVAEVSAWIASRIAGNHAPFVGFTYGGTDQTSCERDVGYIVDALRYDLTYGGNLETIVAARSYYSYGSYVGDPNSKLRALAVQAYLKSIIGYIAKADNGGWTKTPSNALNQDDSTTAGSDDAAIFLQDRFQDIYDTINTGSLPTTIEPNVAWVSSSLVAAKNAIQAKKAGIQAGVIAYISSKYPTLSYNTNTCSRDVGYIVDAVSYDVMFGSNFRSIKAGMSYYQAQAALVLSGQLTPTLDTITFIDTSIRQITTGQAGSVGSTLAVSRIVSSVNTIYDIVASGYGSIPSLSLPTPTGGTGNAYDVDYLNARSQIVNNYAFIQAEIAQYLYTYYNTEWTEMGATGQAATASDVTLILDAIRFDITYGGNLQSLIAGSAYWSNYSLLIRSAWVTATLAAQARLKTIIGQIAQRQSVTITPGNAVSQDLSGTGGNPASGTFAQSRVQDVTDWINNGYANATITPDITWTSSELQASFAALQAKKAEIQSDVVWWVYKNYQNLNFNAETCSRDTGIIVDALSYDMVFGSNFNSITAGRSYLRATTSATVVATLQRAAELGSLNFLKYKAKNIVANGGVALVDAIVSDITGYINGGAIPRSQWNNPATIDSNYAAATVLLKDNMAFIKAEISAWIAVQIGLGTTGFVGLEYSAASCERDVGYIVEALVYDLTYGYGMGGTSNLASRKTGLAYYSALTSVLEIDSNDKTATLAAYNRLKTVVQSIVRDTVVTPSAGNTQSQVRAATGQAVGSAGTATSVGTLVDVITTTINNLGSAPAEVVPVTAWVSTALTTQVASLQANKTSIQGQIISYISTHYPTLTYDVTTCQRDIGIIIDYLGYDLMFDSNYLTIMSARSYYRAQAALVIGSQKDATVACFRQLKTLVLTVVSGNAIATRRVKILMDIIINTMLHGVGSTSEITGTNTYNNDAGVFRTGEIIKLNKNFLAAEATAWITQSYGGTVTSTASASDTFTTSTSHNLTVGDPVTFTGSIIAGSGVTVGTTYFVLTAPTTKTFTITDSQVTLTPVNISADGTGSMTVRYAYDETSCQRDMKEYLEAIIYDLSYTGNYKSLRAAELYLNAVNGSQLSNMYLVRNGTGVRNMTCSGLNGTLTESNDYGTKRPTAGAYVSLDPGFGPNDANVWITSRSCYGQNVTMFGTGCSGAKIDGSLHAAGNRSTVHNDFTTIISDGFGVWCTGANSLTELVSVFNYYGYAGYMAELGGRIRATNGNSSYGTYGVIAEGTDTYEQPVYAVLDNHSVQAVISEVVGDSVAQLYRVEFSNAGTNYTNVDIAFSGDGYNALATGDEFRDGGLFETRLIDLNDGNGYGGTNYGGAQNAAQTGDLVSITLANSDIALSTAYPSMRVQIKAGSGNGQYANILTYNQGTKIAQVTKDSFTTLTVTATSTTNNLLTVASTATLYAGMPIYLTGTMSGTGGITGLSANQLYYIRTSNFSSTQFSVSLTGAAGIVVPISNNVTGLTISLYAAGWDHVVPGTAISNGLDLTSSYIIEPRISYTAPGYTATSRTIQSGAYNTVMFGADRYIAIASSGTSSSYSLDGKTWSAGGSMGTSASWISSTFGGGSGAIATAIVGGLGGSGAVLQAVMGVANYIGDPGADQVVSVKIVSPGHNYSTPPTIIFTPVSGGTGAVATCTVLNGKIDTVTVTVNGSGYNVAPTMTVATDRVTQIIVSQWGRGYNVSVPPTVTLSGGGSSNQATGTPVLNNTGISSITIGNNGGSGYTSNPTVTIVDSNAKFVAIATGSTSTAFLPASAAATDAWTVGGALPTSTMVSIAYGSVGSGVYVTVGGTNAAAKSTNGSTWISTTLPTLASGTYSSVTFGNGYFVAISTGSTLATAVSSNGTTWTAGGTLPVGFTTGTSVAYGNGRFVAIASGGTKTAYSLNNGTTWTSYPVGLPSSQTWTKIKYAQGLFVAIASSSTVCATSPDGIHWTSCAMPGSSSNWSGLAFGNVNHIPLWVAVSNTSGTGAASLNTGAQALGRMKQQAGNVQEVRIVEPGSAYPQGTVTATTVTSNLITVNTTENLIDQQPVLFSGSDAGGLVTEKLYYVIGATITSTQFKVSLVAGSGTPVVLTTTTGLTGTYKAGPIVTQYDPNKIKTAALNPRTGNGVLANPSFSNRGSSYTTATAAAGGDGRADLYQPSTYIAVRNLYKVPQAGANVVFGSIPSTWYKLVAVSNLLGNDGALTATFHISPGLTVLNSPIDGDTVTTTIKYSQVRLTGHDFLYIGTGNQADTNYPYVDPTRSSIAAQTKFSGGGRVFFTSTDQDGNFNVGNLFGVQQSTGTATLNADAFNLSGLQSLQLGALNIGVGSAIITQFSTDPYFTANSDNIVPTQRAIKAYITAQIGGGQSSLNVNTLTAGVVYIANDTIRTTSGDQLNIKSKMNFTGGIDGAPVALGFFLTH